MKCLNLLLLLVGVGSIEAGYEHSSTSQGYYFPMSATPGVTYGAAGMNGMTGYVATTNTGHDLRAYASQPQEYSSASYASAGQSSGLRTDTAALIAAASDHSMSGRNAGAGYAAATGHNIYGANSEQFLPAYANGGHEDNHVSSASNDYSNAGYSHGKEYHSNGYDKFQPAAYSNSIAGQYSHGSQLASKSAAGLYDAHALGNSLAHYGSSQIQSLITHGKTEAIPVSKHVQITKHIPVPVYKQIHIPYQKPVKLQIPHPVLMPISQPYHIQVPITKPYAVPLVQEIAIPVEKIVPYAVEKKIPYPIEKQIPYPIEKHVTVAVPHLYPVKVPVVKTMLHKVKSHGWY